MDIGHARLRLWLCSICSTFLSVRCTRFIFSCMKCVHQPSEFSSGNVLKPLFKIRSGLGSLVSPVQDIESLPTRSVPQIDRG